MSASATPAAVRASSTFVVATAAVSWAVCAEAGSVTSTVIVARAASGTASAWPVADTLTVRACSGGAVVTVVGEQAVRARTARAITGTAVTRRRVMPP